MCHIYEAKNINLLRRWYQKARIRKGIYIWLITHNLIAKNTNLLCRGVGKHIYEYLNLVYQFIKINSSLDFQLEHIVAETKWSPFADDLFKCTFLNENVLILIKISLKFFPKGPIFTVHTL